MKMNTPLLLGGALVIAYLANRSAMPALNGLGDECCVLQVDPQTNASQIINAESEKQNNTALFTGASLLIPLVAFMALK
jgi:hypothetical protein